MTIWDELDSQGQAAYRVDPHYVHICPTKNEEIMFIGDINYDKAATGVYLLPQDKKDFWPWGTEITVLGPGGTTVKLTYPVFFGRNGLRSYPALSLPDIGLTLIVKFWVIPIYPQHKLAGLLTDAEIRRLLKKKTLKAAPIDPGVIIEG